MTAAEKLFADALALPAPERAKLVRRLAATLPSDPAAETLCDAAAPAKA